MTGLMYVALALGGTAVSLDQRPPVREYVDVTGDGLSDILVRDRQTREPILCLVRTSDGGLDVARAEPAGYHSFVCVTPEGPYDRSSGRFLRTNRHLPNSTLRGGIGTYIP